MIEVLKIILGQLIEEIQQKVDNYSFEDFSAKNFKNSTIRNFVSERYLCFQTMLRIAKRFEHSTDFIPEKIYSNPHRHNGFSDEKCDIYFKKEKEIWIEVKFLIPVDCGTVQNFDNMLRDLLRLAYLTEGPNKVELYFIMLVLCGKYTEKRTKLNIKSYFGFNKKRIPYHIFYCEEGRIEAF